MTWQEKFKMKIKLGWGNEPYWLKGGIICTGIILIIFILFFIWFKIQDLLGNLSDISGLAFAGGFFYTFAALIPAFIIGAIIGLIVGKMRGKK